MAFTILIVDDEKEMCVSLAELFGSHGYNAVYATEPQEVPGLVEKNRIDLVLMDIRMPTLGGTDLLKLLKARFRTLPVIMITGYPSVESAVQSMRYGALNVFTKPLPIRELLREIDRIRSSQERVSLAAGDSRIVTANALMLQVLQEIQRVAPTDAPVLITGESGTGKELVASAIHEGSSAGDEPFVKINCASIPDTLLESEMFGHEKGAFTDALRRHVGKLELADRGTIFFDEIGDMSSLARSRSCCGSCRTGSSRGSAAPRLLRTSARLIAATNKDIDLLLSQGVFREDLFYRLSVVADPSPRAARAQGGSRHPCRATSWGSSTRPTARRSQDVSESVQGIFYRHDWPGNVRELRNCIERAAIFCDGPIIGEEHLPAQYLKLRDHGIFRTAWSRSTRGSAGRRSPRRSRAAAERSRRRPRS